VTLVDEVIDAHGGRRRWQNVKEIRTHVRSGGLLLRMKFQSRPIADFGLTVDTGKQSAALDPFPKPGHTGVFAGDAVQVVDGRGSVIKSREGAREAFFGLGSVGRKLWWSELDILYFAGYAMWNYLTIPFLFEWPGFEVSEGEPIEVEGERWRRLNAVFPDDLHTHSRRQCFYFDSRGLLRRHDYTAQVVSRFANAVHLCDEHREVEGLVLPTRRRVVPRLGNRALPGPTLVWIELDSIGVS
jgi:hypothetical protein